MYLYITIIKNIMNLAGTVHVNRNAIFGLLAGVVILFLLYKSDISEAIAFSRLPVSKDELYINLRDVLSAAIDASIRGGKKVADVRREADLHEKSKGKTLEGANNPVTDGDMLSHIEMYHSLKNAFPLANIISEEKESHKGKSSSVPAANINVEETAPLRKYNKFLKPEDIQIWIDPLDATQEYTENLLEYVTTMVCVAVKGVPTIGVIHKPFSNWTAWAWVDYGHSQTFTVPTTAVEAGGKASSPRIIVSRSHKGEVEKVAKDAFGADVVITDAGGAGYKIIEVLNGKQDVYVHTSLIKKWDICAGNAIINHFKGNMTTLTGNVIDYSTPSDFKNPEGLVASLFNHEYYLNKLKALKHL